jgi:hypothetical protein
LHKYDDVLERCYSDARKSRNIQKYEFKAKYGK